MNKYTPRLMVNEQTYAPEVHRGRISEFLREWTVPTKTKALRCWVFVLAHIGLDAPSAITTLDIDPKLGEADRLARCDEVANMVLQSAQSIAAVAQDSKVQKFSLLAYPNTNTEQSAHGQVQFALEAPMAMHGGMPETEDATPYGQAMTGLRWGENGMRMATSTMLQALDKYERMAERAFDRCEALLDQNMRLTEQRETLLDRSAERGIITYAKKLEIDRNERMYQALEVFGAHLLGKYLGTGAPPAAASLGPPRTTGPVSDDDHPAAPLIALFHEMPQAETAAMMAALSPEWKTRITNAFMSYGMAMQARRARTQEAAGKAAS